MTILQRAATLAAMTFALAGLTGIATPGLAAEVGQTSPIRLTPAVLIQSATNPAAALADPAIPSSDTVTAPVAAAEPVPFETLAAAVAAQDAANAADADEPTRCLAGAVYFEAKGEPIDGQLAVAEVIMNRAGSGRFPPDVCGVVKQRGQFSFVRSGEIPAVASDRANYRTALAVAKVAMAKAWESSAPHALYFHERHVAASARMVKVAAIGNHIFYR